MPGERNKIAVVIDSNIWVSFAIGKRMSSLRDVVLDPSVETYASLELIDEVKETLKKPKIRKYTSASRAKAALKLMKQSVYVIRPKSSVTISRDHKDDFLLALSTDCHAKFLITGDKDLLSLESYGETEIISFSDFLRRFKGH